jgi:hypothetical protein
VSEDTNMLQAERPPDGAIWVESIGLDTMEQRRERPRAGRWVRNLPITLNGLKYAHGIGTRSISEFLIDLHGSATRFVSVVGLDDVVKAGVGSATFEVWADDKLVASSGPIRSGDAPKLLSDRRNSRAPASVSGARHGRTAPAFCRLQPASGSDAGCRDRHDHR